MTPGSDKFTGAALLEVLEEAGGCSLGGVKVEARGGECSMEGGREGGRRDCPGLRGGLVIVTSGRALSPSSLSPPPLRF